MIGDRHWFERNLGYDPVAVLAPPSRSAIAGAPRPPRGKDLQRQIIDFDSEADEGRRLLAFSKATGLSRFTEIPWPARLAPPHDAHYLSAPPRTKYFARAKTLFKANAAHLPQDNKRPPKIVVAVGGIARSVPTTDFFGFDTSDYHDHLQGLGDVSEMGDAVLGLVAGRMNGTAPRWLAVRNVSDPQIKAEAPCISRPRSPRRSTRATGAGARSAARSSAGR